MARLILESGGEGKEVRVAGAVTIGRLKTCTLTVDHKTVSREHAKVSFDGKRYVVQDLDSTSGTFVNGRRIAQPTALTDGDTIKVGPAVLRLRLDASELPPPEPVAQPARARPRSPEEIAAAQAGVSPAGAFFLYLFLLVVLAGATFGSKLVFGQLIPRFFP
jgi:pSer/pThr/pTyr-binding forkhead associated (FHA) protein